MRKLISLFFSFILLFMIGCSSQKTFNFYLPDGTPALTVASLLAKKDSRINFNFVNATEIAGAVASNDCDMAIMPTISAATIYQKKSVDIKMVSNNVFGSLYLASKAKIENINELKGHIIYSTAGTTIDMMKYILDKNNIHYNLSSEIKEDEVSITTASSAQEIIPILSKNDNVFGVLGEPVLSRAMNKISNLNIVLDLQSEYSKINNSNSFPQACFVVKNDMIKNNNDILLEIIELLKENKTFIGQNLASLNSIYQEYNSSLKDIDFDNDLIDRCNIDFKMAKDIKEEVNKYVLDLGNIELDDEFYY